MLRYIILAILALHFAFSNAQIQGQETEVLIIGTIHNGNKHFNHRTLYKTIKQYKPDVILWEYEKPFKPVVGLLTAFCLGIAKTSIEQLSLQKYSRYNKGIQVLPYDTSFDSRKRYIKENQRFAEAFFNSLEAARKSPADSVLYAAFAQMWNNYYAHIANASLAAINKPATIEMTKTLYNYELGHIVQLGRIYVQDSMLVQQYEDELKFWIARNNHMVREILKYSVQYAGKKMIILTGLNHKYYLLEKLREQEAIQIKIIELDSK